MDTENNIIPAPLIKRFENHAPRGRALDIGAGKGNNALFLASQGLFTTAVEIRKDLAEIIKNRATENRLDLEIVNQDIRYFNIEESYYSFVSAMNSLNFFSKKEFYEIIEKIKMGLIENGICVISLFTTADSLFAEIKSKTKVERDGGLYNNEGRKWYFLKPNELKEIFEKDFEILFYVEAEIDDKKGHPGNLYPHKHSVARIAIKK